MGLLDSLMIATPTNDFLERLDYTLDWKPLETVFASDVSGDDRASALRAAGALQDEFASALLWFVRPAVRGNSSVTA
jgi:hypothetical protein